LAFASRAGAGRAARGRRGGGAARANRGGLRREAAGAHHLDAAVGLADHDLLGRDLRLVGLAVVLQLDRAVAHDVAVLGAPADAVGRRLHALAADLHLLA